MTTNKNYGTRILATICLTVWAVFTLLLTLFCWIVLVVFAVIGAPCAFLLDAGKSLVELLFEWKDTLKSRKPDGGSR